jgi:protoporphyrinogen/coproporphyrinogen III oxidase
VSTVLVVGGGITGLACAHALAHAPDPPAVTLVEADDRLGGKVLTTPFAGLPAVDEGPDAVLARVPWGVDLLQRLGLPLTSPATGRAYVWWGHKLHPIPAGLVLGVPAGLPGLAKSNLLSWRGKARAAIEPLLPRNRAGAGDNVGTLVRQRFGAEVLERLVDPLVGSINAGDADDLSLQASVPQLAAAAERSRSLLLGLRANRPKPPAPGTAAPPVFVAPEAGMGALVTTLAADLSGVTIRSSTNVTALRPLATGPGWEAELGGGERLSADAVVLATPAYAAADLLGLVAPGAAAGLREIAYASVALVTLAVPRSAIGVELDGSGHLVPKPAQRHVTACSWASTKWARWRLDGDRVLLRASLGRHGDEHAVDLDDGAVIEAALADLRTQLGLRADPSDARVTRWPRSFPQYEPGHLDRVAAIEAALAAEAPGVVVAGAAFRGVGIPACIRQGGEAAAAARAALASR